MADMEVLAPGGHQHLVEKIKEQLAMKADASLASAVEKVIENQPTAVLGGTVLTASDAYAEPPVSVTVDGKSTQDGTPTPDAPVEIVSVENPELNFAGKQLMDWAHPFRTGSYNYDIAVGTTIASGTSSNVEVSVEGNTLTMYIAAAWNGAIWRSPNLPNGKYYIYLPLASDGGTGSGTSHGSTLFIVDKNNRVLRKYSAHASTGNWSYVVTLTGDEAAICVNAGTRSGTSGKTFIYDSPRLVAGDVLTDYAPFSMQSVSLPVTLRSLPDGIKDTLALSYLRPSTREGWAWYAPTLTTYVLEFTKTTGFEQFHATSSGHNRVRLAATGAAAAEGHSLCNRFVYNSSTYNYGVPGDYYISRNYMYCIVPDTITTIEDANAWLAENPITLVYRNSPPTPTVTQLDPIELPVLPAPDVTVWCDPSTGLQMRYVRDMQIVIDSLNSEIERAYAAIAPVESTTAKSNHAVGDYLMLGGTLCKVTSAIASGETIAIGTNVAATTVDAELASLE